MLLVACCFMFLLGESLGSPSANQYFDNVFHIALTKVLRNMKLDPAPLPDYSYEYYDKTFIGKIKGKVDYTDGWLMGLSHVARIGDCSGPLNVTGHVSINCTLDLNELKTDYHGKVKYGILPKVSITAKATVAPTYVIVEVAKFRDVTNAVVKSFNFRGVGNLQTDFSGLGPLNKHMKVLEANYKEVVPKEIEDIINRQFLDAINLAVAQVPMPVH